MNPEADADSFGFWEGLEEGILLVPHCDGCGRLFFPPLPSCPNCGSTEVRSERLSGQVRAYSWITVHRALDPDFEELVPYTLVTASLVEEASARIVALLDSEGAELEDGTLLQVFPLRRNGAVVPGVRTLQSGKSVPRPSL